MNCGIAASTILRSSDALREGRLEVLEEEISAQEYRQPETNTVHNPDKLGRPLVRNAGVKPFQNGRDRIE